MEAIRGAVALVTGAANGIGLAIAEALADEGAAVMLTDIDGDGAEARAAALRARGVQAEAMALDVTDPAAWEAVRDGVTSRLGPVRILVNNAGVFAGAGPVERIDPAVWRWMFAVNVDAHLHALRSILPGMKAAALPCHIVNTVSLAGLVAIPGTGIYNASKFAALGLAETLRFELQGTQIGITVLCPGMVATELAKTSHTHRPAGTREDEAARDAMATALSRGMPAAAIGRRVVQAIKADEFYVITHRDYKPVLQRIGNNRAAACDRPADAAYRENMDMLTQLYGLAEGEVEARS